MQDTTVSDFYVTGGTLRQDALSYVEHHADKELFEGLSRGEFCYVLTSRQMGKSSLMVHTAARLPEAGTQVVVLDLTAIGQNLGFHWRKKVSLREETRSEGAGEGET